VSNLYETLNVPKDASPEQIKKAHRKAVRKHHPDKKGDPEQFHKVQHAYLVLSNPVRRQKYDETGEDENALSNMLSEIAEIILPAFDHAFDLAGPAYAYRDLIADTRKLLEERKSKVKAERGNIETRIKRIEQVIKLLKFKEGEADIIGNSFRFRLQKAKQELTTFEQVLASMDAAIEYLKNYGFEFKTEGVMFKSGFTNYGATTA
jgi:curved DNA-binding protein CbpA